MLHVLFVRVVPAEHAEVRVTIGAEHMGLVVPPPESEPLEQDTHLPSAPSKLAPPLQEPPVGRPELITVGAEQEGEAVVWPERVEPAGQDTHRFDPERAPS